MKISLVVALIRAVLKFSGNMPCYHEHLSPEAARQIFSGYGR